MPFQKGHKINVGRKHREESKRLMSIVSMGKKGTFGMKGKHHSVESRKKISDGHKGLISPLKGRKTGIPAWNKGKKLSQKYRKKLSISHLGQKPWNRIGKETSEYKKVRKNIDFRLWRESVFKRDNYTCKRCSKRNGDHHPHHILNFSQYRDLRFEINNGITLCDKCHYLFHKTFGYLNNNSEQINIFIKQYV